MSVNGAYICLLFCEGSRLLMEGLSVPKDSIKMIKSWPTLGLSQAGGAGECGIGGRFPDPRQPFPSIFLASH